MGDDKPPKVILEVNGKPLIVHLLDMLSQLGIDCPYVVVGHRQELIRSAISDRNVQYVEQLESKGTGHAVLAAKSAVDERFERVFLLYGDTPFVSAKTLRATHAKLDDPTVVCALVTATRGETTERFGRIVRSDAGDLQAIVEYKNATDEQRAITEVNVGAYCARLPWLWEALSQVEINPVTNEYYLTDIVQIALRAKQRVVPVLTSMDESHGIDTPGAYELVKSAKVGENTNR